MSDINKLEIINSTKEDKLLYDEFKNNKIEYYQNIVCFFISTIVSLNMCYYYLFDNNSLYISCPVLFLFFIFDFPFSRLEIKIHHIFGLLLITSFFLLKIPIQLSNFILLSIYKTELSTFFLIFKLMNKDNYLIKKYNLSPKLFLLNDLIFFVSFFKFRLLDYYNEIIVNVNTYNVINKYSENNLIGSVAAYTGINGLFLLNSYWFCIMCKILFKKILANYSKKTLEIISEKFLSYTYFVNIFIAGYVYSFSPKQSNIYDMVGITTLSIFSYKYHNEEYKLLINKNNELNPRYNSNKLDKLLICYLQDKLAIHCRSFLCILTNGNFDINTHFFLSNKEILSIIIHINSFILSIFFIHFICSKNVKVPFMEHPQRNNFMLILNLLISIPILYDMYVIISSSNELVYSINTLLVTLLIGLTLKINIFYEMNHIAFHILLMAQTYCLSTLNIYCPRLEIISVKGING
jgi:hypothetical protein